MRKAIDAFSFRKVSLFREVFITQSVCVTRRTSPTSLLHSWYRKSETKRERNSWTILRWFFSCLHSSWGSVYILWIAELANPKKSLIRSWTISSTYIRGCHSFLDKHFISQLLWAPFTSPNVSPIFLQFPNNYNNFRGLKLGVCLRDGVIVWAKFLSLRK